MIFDVLTRQVDSVSDIYGQYFLQSLKILWHRSGAPILRGVGKAISHIFKSGGDGLVIWVTYF